MRDFADLPDDLPTPPLGQAPRPKEPPPPPAPPAPPVLPAGLVRNAFGGWSTRFERPEPTEADIEMIRADGGLVAENIERYWAEEARIAEDEAIQKLNEENPVLLRPGESFTWTAADAGRPVGMASFTAISDGSGVGVDPGTVKGDVAVFTNYPGAAPDVGALRTAAQMLDAQNVPQRNRMYFDPVLGAVVSLDRLDEPILRPIEQCYCDGCEALRRGRWRAPEYRAPAADPSSVNPADSPYFQSNPDRNAIAAALLGFMGDTAREAFRLKPR